MIPAVILVAFAISAIHAAGLEYSIPARPASGFRLQVPVRVNGNGPFWCTLDSGAGGDGFILDVATGKYIGLHPSRQASGTGEGLGMTQDDMVLDATLEIGDLRIPHRTVAMRPLHDQCILGTVVLGHFVVEIDYLTPAIRLYSARGYLPAKGAAMVPLTLDGSRRPMIHGKLLLQPGVLVDAHLLLDSAVPDYALSLSKAFTDRHQILAKVGKVIRPSFRGEGTGGKIDLLATRIDRLSVGSVRLDNPIVMLFRTPSGAPRGSQPDGLIGSGFLRRFLVTIDVPNGHLYLTPNKHYRGPEPRWPWAAGLQPTPTKEQKSRMQ